MSLEWIDKDIVIAVTGMTGHGVVRPGGLVEAISVTVCSWYQTRDELSLVMEWDVYRVLPPVYIYIYI